MSSGDQESDWENSCAILENLQSGVTYYHVQRGGKHVKDELKLLCDFDGKLYSIIQKKPKSISYAYIKKKDGRCFIEFQKNIKYYMHGNCL